MDPVHDQRKSPAFQPRESPRRFKMKWTTPLLLSFCVLA